MSSIGQRGLPTWREWLGLAAGLLAAVSLFLPWTRLSSPSPEIQAVLAELPGADVSRSVWDSTFFAWFPPLLILAIGVAVAVFGRVPSARTGGLPHLWLIAAGVALVALALGWLLIEWQFSGEARALLAESGVSIGAGPGRYLGLAAVLVSLVAAVLDVRAVRAESRRPRRPHTRR
ncbi:hypothetical protein [Prauserella muralis]|uniref:Uncharacterized protein n=1 Tax=Prauserella muralis TaxID=588067 RepID=A0A2V4BBK7_9PSEU|nr:hypothetical protein [Prauserella muralis]PXY27029.1 hypothetical protein BAY60_11075 [Prauserella muralis]TWE23348.1 hypothetical protein FHX69_4611 [Prauserella muralis]